MNANLKTAAASYKKCSFLNEHRTIGGKKLDPTVFYIIGIVAILITVFPFAIGFEKRFDRTFLHLLPCIAWLLLILYIAGMGVGFWRVALLIAIIVLFVGGFISYLMKYGLGWSIGIIIYNALFVVAIILTLMQISGFSSRKKNDS